MSVHSFGGGVYADQRRTAGLPGGNDCPAHWEQVEAADPSQPAGPPVAVQ